MADMYFAREPEAASRIMPCSFVYRGEKLTFETDSGVFSKGELDTGTELLLNALPDLKGDVLDLGCGWGAIGIAVSKANPETNVTMVDVNLRAQLYVAHAVMGQMREQKSGLVVNIGSITGGTMVFFLLGILLHCLDLLTMGYALLNTAKMVVSLYKIIKEVGSEE